MKGMVINMKRSQHAIRIISGFILIATVCAFSSCRKINKDDYNNDANGKFSYETEESVSKGSYNGFNYEVTPQNTINITGYHGEDKNPTVPNTIKDIAVTKIVDGAIRENTSIESITISEGITYIGTDAFKTCSNLSKVTIPSTVTVIDGNAFQGTPFLNNITDEYCLVGNGVLLDYNGSSADIIIPDSVKYISSAFSINKNITTVKMPDTVTDVGSYAFMSCSKLKNITMSNNLKSIGSRAFAKCSALEKVTIPNSVTSLSNMSFMMCDSLKELTLSSSLETIPQAAFQVCSSLDNVIIPDSVKKIENQAFFRCKSLKAVTIGISVDAIDEYNFDDCDKNLTITCPAGSAAAQFCTEQGIKTIAK